MNLKTYLFLPQSCGNKIITQGYIAVKQAYIDYEIADKTERVGNYGILFTTKKTLVEVTKMLKMKKNELYLLVELTDNISSESISVFMPNTDIDELRNLNLENIKDNAKWLESQLSIAVEDEDYERACSLRDLIKKQEN